MRPVDREERGILTVDRVDSEDAETIDTVDSEEETGAGEEVGLLIESV